MSARKATKADTRPLRAVIYVRISLDRAGAGLGVDRQEKDARLLAKRLGVTVVGLYVDNDISASNKKIRPQYQRLLADMRAGLVDMVLVWHTDRLHRQPVELEEFIEIAEGRKPVVTVQACQAGPLDLATPGGRMAARMLAAAAKYEVELKSERHKAANLQSALAGKPPRTGAGRAFGFEMDGVTHRPAEAAAIRKAVKAVLAGESLLSIAKAWNASGMATSTGATWEAQTVAQVLKKPRHAGLRAYNGEIVARGTWKPIVDEETWHALQAFLRDPGRRLGPGPRPRWLLSGIAMCGYPGCRHTMKAGVSSAASNRTASNRPVYRCRTGGHLSRSSIALDAFVSQLVVARLSRPDATQLLLEEKDIDLTALHAEARELRVRQEALALQAAEGGITPRQMATINQKIGAKLSEIETQIASASQGSVFVGVIGAHDVQTRWDSLTLDRRRAIVDTLLTITVLPLGKGAGQLFDPEGVLVEWRKPGTPAPKRYRGNKR